MKVLKKYANCQQTGGYLRTVISDLKNGNYYLIPSSLNTELTLCLDNAFRLIPKKIKAHISFLLKNNYLFYRKLDEISFFPELNLDWVVPSLCTNAIVIYKNINYLETIVEQLERLGCYNYSIVFFDFDSFKKSILQIQEKINNKLIKGIEIFIPHSYDIEPTYLFQISNQVPQVTQIVIFNSPKNQVLFSDVHQKRLVSEQEKILCAKIILPSEFSVNLQMYCESQLHNTYFNRKLSIDENGYIKNSHELEWHYGHVNETKLEDAIKDEGTDTNFFKKYAHYKQAQKEGKEYELDFEKTKPAFNALYFIHKEKIDVCRDCEFRHMCVDACVPLQREDDTWYRSQECNYNPYICKWEGEEGYQTLAACGVECTIDGYSIDHAKIDVINNVLWTE